MGGWSHNFGSFVHVFDGETIWRSVERRTSKRIQNAVPKTADDNLDEYLASLNYEEFGIIRFAEFNLQ